MAPPPPPTTPDAPPAPGPVDDPRTPEAALATWPHDRPIAAFGVGPASLWSRWSILGEPRRTVRARTAAEAHALLDEVFAGPPRGHPEPAGGAPPFQGGWIGCLSYGLGRLLEPRAAHDPAPADDRGWPAAFFHRCDRGWCFDKQEGRWWAFGGAGPLPGGAAGPEDLTAGPWRLASRGAYEARIARTLEYIRAGDIYQANIAHRLTGRFEGRATAALARLGRAGPWYGGLVVDEEGPERRAVVSASPELFFRYEAAARRVTTRPMKGTRPAGGARELESSAKDRAELAMIVDLMRNDLGRVCSFGTVAVEEGRAIERHGGVLQAVSSVSGRLRPGVTLADAVRAVFPAGSVTGAPKIRAMQVIEELEGVGRGPYCGAVGYVSASGDACFAVAIRTLAVRGEGGGAWDRVGSGEADYWAGAGIVADSDPAGEWEETVVKLDPLRAAFGPGAVLG